MTKNEQLSQHVNHQFEQMEGAFTRLGNRLDSMTAKLHKQQAAST